LIKTTSYTCIGFTFDKYLYCISEPHQQLVIRCVWDTYLLGLGGVPVNLG